MLFADEQCHSDKRLKMLTVNDCRPHIIQLLFYRNYRTAKKYSLIILLIQVITCKFGVIFIKLVTNKC